MDLANLDLELQNAENKRNLINQELERLNDLIAQLQEKRLNDYGENSSTLINPSSLLNKYDFDGDGIISIIDYYILLGAIDGESFVIDNELYDPEGARDATPTFNGKPLNVFDNNGDDLELNDLDMAEYINLLFEKIYSFIDINLGPNTFKRYNNNFNDDLEENDSDLEAIKHYWNTFGRIPTLDELKNFNPSINQYFTIESLEDNNSIYWKAETPNSEYFKTLMWTQDFKNWTSVTSSFNGVGDNGTGTLIKTLNQGEKIYIKGYNNTLSYANIWTVSSVNGLSFNDGGGNIDNYTKANHFVSTARFNISGNIMSLLYGDNFNNKTTFNPDATYIFDGVFKDCTHLVSAKNLILPTVNLTYSCYYAMFDHCTALTDAPQIFAESYGEISCSYMFSHCTSLTNIQNLTISEITGSRCCAYMFNHCTALKTTPELKASVLKYGCYSYMFIYCTALENAPKLYATTLANNCYESMFSGTSIKRAPALPVKTLAQECYRSMFANTLIVTAPILPATTLTKGCYRAMFFRCKKLKHVTTLRATTLAPECYRSMFRECTSLVTPPEIKATVLAEPQINLLDNGNTKVYTGCYQSMFQDCTSLRTAPELKATELTIACYSNMFYGCISLTTAPKLPAKNLTKLCYTSMFSGCKKLNFIECLATYLIPSVDDNVLYPEDCYKYWLINTSNSGTLVIDNNGGMMFNDNNNDEMIPNGWEILTEDEYNDLTNVSNYNDGVGEFIPSYNDGVGDLIEVGNN